MDSIVLQCCLVDKLSLSGRPLRVVPPLLRPFSRSVGRASILVLFEKGGVEERGTREEREGLGRKKGQNNDGGRKADQRGSASYSCPPLIQSDPSVASVIVWKSEATAARHGCLISYPLTCEP